MLIRFINCNKCATLDGDDENGGGCACVDTAGIRETSEPSSQFCCESKSAPKI